MSNDLSEELRAITYNYTAGQWNSTGDFEFILSRLQATDEQQKYVRRQVVVTITLTLMAIGITANLLSAVVLVRQLLRKSSAYVLLLMLCLADIAVIGVHAYSIIKSVVPEQKFTNAAQCKCFKFFWHTAFQWSSWCIVLITAERLWSVVAPLGDQNNHRRIRQAFKLAGLVTCIIGLLNVHILFSTQFLTLNSLDISSSSSSSSSATDHIKQHKDNSSATIRINQPQLPQQFNFAAQLQLHFEFNGSSGIHLDEALAVCESHPRELVWYQHLLLYAVIPYGLVFALNTAILFRIAYFRTRDNRRITATLMGMTFSFVIFTLPYSIMFLGVASIKHSYYNLHQLWLRDAVRLLLLAHHSILHFVSYLLLGPQFRAGCIKTFCMWWARHDFQDTQTRAFRSRAHSFSRGRGEILLAQSAAVMHRGATNGSQSQRQQQQLAEIVKSYHSVNTNKDPEIGKPTADPSLHHENTTPSSSDPLI